MDIFVRLASQSDPISVSYRRSLTCERCDKSGHSIRSKCCESHNIQDPSIIDALRIRFLNLFLLVARLVYR